MIETIKKNLLQIQEEIAPCKPRIIAVTKYFDKDAIIAAYNAGFRDFGESRVIEASEKINNLPDEIKNNSTFHLIGHLQTNKVKQAVNVFDYIHSVDSVKLAQSISQHANQIGKIQKILIQVNNANEEQKFGFSKEEVFKNFEQIKNLESLEIAGVMNMAPLGIEPNEIAKLFSEIVQIRNKLEKEFNCKLQEISMGMSQDYKIAAQQGSTMLRVGRKLFN
uniref:Pyridoxal phosphate homeostasis protein n=1 Tax=uncultured Candidatus Melainabacteria bacterium TaxID=2682970 RepID=A0A650EL14_9BACT|nr:YggS family pyridoxal phosphate enzyme [uncultured Candidatus Melainabacteria bacterium]